MHAPAENTEASPAPAYQAGWEALVGPLADASVVCLDDGLLAVSAMAMRCARVCALSVDDEAAAKLRQHIATSGWTHVTVLTLGLAGEMSSLTTAAFDGAVLCDLSGQVQGKLRGGLAALVCLVRPLLRDGAFVLAGAPNRFAVSRERIAQGLAVRNAWTWRGLSRLVHAAGAGSVVLHPIILNEHNCVAEKICEGGYHATKNSGLRRERLKEWLWGSRTARWFAPALLAVGWVGAARNSTIERVRESLELRGGCFVLTQYLALMSGKVIATFASTTPGQTDRVVVITHDALTIARRTKEALTLAHLEATLPREMAALLPGVLDRFSVDGCECFVLRHVPGVTADAVVPGLAQVTERAQGFLLDLHRATARRTVMTEAAWSAGVGAIFTSATRRNPGLAPELRQLESSIRDRVVEQEWYEVCSHGDFKIENVMYDAKSHEITGVIDWEHALMPGIPYIDTAYLLTYNRMLHGQSWIEAARAILESSFDARELAIESAYWCATGLPKRLIPVWRALALVHHIGYRWHGKWAASMIDEIKALMVMASRLIEQSPLPPAHLCGEPVHRTTHATRTET